MRFSRLFMISTVVALCLISFALLILRAYGPIDDIQDHIPKQSSHLEGDTVPPSYYNDVGPIIDAPVVHDEEDVSGAMQPSMQPRANATFVMLMNNDDVDRAVVTIRELESRFNLKYNYPWVFLNGTPFSDDFKRRVSAVASGPVYFEKIPDNHWYQPNWINETRAEEAREKMGEQEFIFVQYRNMCRFNSGFFFRQPLLLNFRYYWRVEPGVKYHCDINFDPFLFMQDNNKVYGFTLTLFEHSLTIKTLWSTVRDFVTEHPEFISPNSAMDFISDNGGESYNLCHFWSNFEIGDLDFWRGPAYTAYFDYLDSRGGFYYERWCDAPVHSIAAALLGGTDKIHFFREIGYERRPFTHCPTDEDLWRQGRCTCNPAVSWDYNPLSCLRRWEKLRLS